MKIYFSLFFLISNACFGFGQDQFIHGTIVNPLTSEAIPYVNVINLSTQKNTKTNEHGQFRLTINEIKDSFYIYSLGYEKLKVKFYASDSFCKIVLKPKTIQLLTVKIKSSDNTYLFKLIEQIRTRNYNQTIESKAYFELKSYINSTQVELLESYYNITQSGQDIKSLNLKAGRFGLRKEAISNRYFTSQEITPAIIDLKLFDKSKVNFPISPLWFSTKKLRKHFYLQQEEEFLTADLDSIISISFIPKDTLGDYFSGKIWVNKTKLYLEKITLNCKNARRFPITSIHKYDTIKKVDFNITSYYDNLKEYSIIKQIDFNYSINYISAHTQNQAPKLNNINTHAILYTYDKDSLFILPKINISKFFMKDYSNINAFPYNDFFWRFNTEDRITANKLTNDKFYYDSCELTNQNSFIPNNKEFFSIHEKPFIHWSENRIIFVEDLRIPQIQFDKRTLGKIEKELAKEDWIKRESKLARLYGSTFKPYQFSFNLFLDINKYRDSIDYLTSVVLDPFESYCYLLLDKKTHCVINLLFDSHKIVANRLKQNLMKSKFDINEINSIYDAHVIDKNNSYNSIVKLLNYDYEKNLLNSWNRSVLKELNINNMNYFELDK